MFEQSPSTQLVHRTSCFACTLRHGYRLSVQNFESTTPTQSVGAQCSTFRTVCSIRWLQSGFNTLYYDAERCRGRRVLNPRTNKISHIFLGRRVNASGRVDKNREKIATVRPFEPSSTVVHPCTTVEGEFCAYTKHRCCMELLPSLAVLVE